MKQQVIAELLRAARPELANVLAYHVTAAKQVYYHGTSTVFAKRILSEGFVPDPKRKVWDPESGRLASYAGTYFTRDLGTASLAAQNAAIKFGGRKCLFEVQLETRTALMDEDQLPNMVGALAEGAGRHYGRRYDIARVIYDKVTDDYRAETQRAEVEKWLASPEMKAIVDTAADVALDQFTETLWEDMKLSPQYMKVLRDAAKPWAWAVLQAAADGHDVNRLSGTDTPEIRAAKNVFMKAAGSVAKQRDDYRGNNARVLEPVTFRGANRILSAVVRMKYDDPVVQPYRKSDDDPVFVVYGKPSGTMLSGMRRAGSIKLIPMRLSKIPNVFDPYKKQQKMAANVVAADTDTYFIWLTGDVTFNRKVISKALREMGVKYSRETDPSGLKGFRVELRFTQHTILKSKIELARSGAGKREGGYRIEKV